jgi:hypothetical protein
MTKNARWTGAGVAFGLVAAVASGALAIWALGWAAAPPPAIHAKTDLSPALLVTLVVSVVALISLLATLRARPPAEPGERDEVSRALTHTTQATDLAEAVALVAVIALLIAAYATGLPGKLVIVEQHAFPASQSYAAAAAWLLGLLGNLVVAVGLWPKSSRRTAVRLHFSGAAVAAIVALIAVFVVVQRSDEQRAVDATTAAEVPTAPVPATLGERRFSITAKAMGTPAAPVDQVAAAGAGFVVLEKRGVRSYDPEGHLRWLYLRSDRRDINADAMRVFDDGRTVVLRLVDGEGPGGGWLANRVVALDAMTGHQLWQRDDFDDQYPLHSPRWMTANSRYMLVDGDHDRLTRIDTRTGHPAWTTTLARDEDHCDGGGVDTAAAIVYVEECITSGEATLRLTSVAPDSGRTTDSLVERFMTDWRSGSGVGFDVLPAADDAIAVQDIRLEALRQKRWDVIWIPTAATAWTGRPASFVGSPGPDVLTSEPDPGGGSDSWAYAMRSGPELKVRCLLPVDASAGGTVAWLPDEVVVPQPHTGITAFDRTTCAPRPSHAPASSRPQYVIPAPGVVLAIAKGSSTITIDGYS